MFWNASICTQTQHILGIWIQTANRQKIRPWIVWTRWVGLDGHITRRQVYTMMENIIQTEMTLYRHDVLNTWQSFQWCMINTNLGGEHYLEGYTQSGASLIKRPITLCIFWGILLGGNRGGTTLCWRRSRDEFVWDNWCCGECPSPRCCRECPRYPRWCRECFGRFGLWWLALWASEANGGSRFTTLGRRAIAVTTAWFARLATAAACACGVWFTTLGGIWTWIWLWFTTLGGIVIIVIIVITSRFTTLATWFWFTTLATWFWFTTLATWFWCTIFGVIDAIACGLPWFASCARGSSCLLSLASLVTLTTQPSFYCLTSQRYVESKGVDERGQRRVSIGRKEWRRERQ